MNNSETTNLSEYILIVGGAGYIGSHTNKQLNKLGYKTVVFDNLSMGHREFVKWGKFYKGDILNISDLQGVFNKFNIKAVLHFAAHAYVGESVVKPAKYYHNNVAGTINLLNTMIEHNVRYMIFSSSCAAYGIPHDLPIKETHPLNPINPYGRSKVMVETILRDYGMAYGMRSIALRYFNAAGADPDGQIGEDHKPETHLIPRLLQTMTGKYDSFTIFGTDYDTPDGTCIRDYIHVNDLAVAHCKAMEKLIVDTSENRMGYLKSYNLGTGKGYSVREIITAASKIACANPNIHMGEKRPGDPPVLFSSCQLSAKELKWQPVYDDLETIIRHAWNWHNSQDKAEKNKTIN